MSFPIFLSWFLYYTDYEFINFAIVHGAPQHVHNFIVENLPHRDLVSNNVRMMSIYILLIPCMFSLLMIRCALALVLARRAI